MHLVLRSVSLHLFLESKKFSEIKPPLAMNPKIEMDVKPKVETDFHAKMEYFDDINKGMEIIGNMNIPVKAEVQENNIYYLSKRPKMELDIKSQIETDIKPKLEADIKIKIEFEEDVKPRLESKEQLLPVKIERKYPTDVKLDLLTSEQAKDLPSAQRWDLPVFRPLFFCIRLYIFIQIYMHN